MGFARFKQRPSFLSFQHEGLEFRATWMSRRGDPMWSPAGWRTRRSAPTEHIFADLDAGYPRRHDERCYLNLLVSHWQSFDSKWKNLSTGA